MCWDHDDADTDSVFDRFEVELHTESRQCCDCYESIKAGEGHLVGYWHELGASIDDEPDNPDGLEINEDYDQYIENTSTAFVCRRCCFTRMRIEIIELSHGCRPQNASPSYGGIDDWYSGTFRDERHFPYGPETKPEDVPAWFRFQDSTGAYNEKLTLAANIEQHPWVWGRDYPTERPMELGV